MTVSTEKANNFLVYAYSDENWNFYYIGKGKPRRPYSNNRYVKKPEDLSHIHILEEGLDEQTAYGYEKLLISLYGRRDINPEWGVLLNSTNGGGGTSGYKWDPKKLEKISGKNHHRCTPHSWCHVEYGFIKDCSCAEIVNMYPKDNLCYSGLNYLALGKIKRYKGWIIVKITEEEKSMPLEELKKVYTTEYAKTVIKSIRSEVSNSKRGSKNISYTPRSWCHPEKGLVLDKSCSDMVGLFPEMSLTISGLSKLCTGKVKSYKNWIFVNENDIDRCLSLEDLNKKFSGEYAKLKLKEYKDSYIKNNPAFNMKGELNFMYNKRGEKHPRFGCTLSDETRSRISKKARSRFTQRNWFHPDYGLIENVLACELSEMFPAQKLSLGLLSSVAHGKRRQHKGWTCKGS